MKYTYVPFYLPWINNNDKIGKLQNWASSLKELKHYEDNTTRKDKTNLNPNPKFKNEWIAIDKKMKSVEDIKNDFISIRNELKKGGKGAKPFRFLVGSLNLAPDNPANKELFDKYVNDLTKVLQQEWDVIAVAKHFNEISMGYHFIFRNYSKEKKEWGNFVNGELISHSGKNQKRFKDFKQKLIKFTEDWLKINAPELVFNQNPYSVKGQDRIISRFKHSSKKKIEDWNQKDKSNFKRFIQLPMVKSYLTELGFGLEQETEQVMNDLIEELKEKNDLIEQLTTLDKSKYIIKKEKTR